jgi:hypothetical protein
MLVLSDDTIVDTPEGVVKPTDFRPGEGAGRRRSRKSEFDAALHLYLKAKACCHEVPNT